LCSPCFIPALTCTDKNSEKRQRSWWPRRDSSQAHPEYKPSSLEQQHHHQQRQQPARSCLDCNLPRVLPNCQTLIAGKMAELASLHCVCSCDVRARSWLGTDFPWACSYWCGWRNATTNAKLHLNLWPEHSVRNLSHFPYRHLSRTIWIYRVSHN
jgi:hypothetical protein